MRSLLSSFFFLFYSALLFAEKSSEKYLEVPLRMEDLDGPTISDYRNLSYKPALFFPRFFDPFVLIEAGDPNFLSLDALRKNPELARDLPEKLPDVFGIVSADDPPTRKPEPMEDDLASRVRMIEEKLLGLDNVVRKRTDDNQLAEFLRRDDNDLLQRADELQAMLEKASSSGRTDPQAVSADQPRDLSDVLIPEPPPVKPKHILGWSPFDPPLASASTTKTLSGLGFKTDESSDTPSGSILKLKASVPMPDGKAKPAQASDFYVTTKNVTELLSKLNLEEAVAGEVSSLVELWGQAEKNRSANREVALRVQSILFEAKVRSTRTDPYGKAAVAGLSPDEKYYLIGVGKDVDTQIVTIWSKEVKVAPGENEVELTAGDVIFNK